MLTAIIVAGGRSRRMGFDKTFALLNGQPVLARSIAAFEQTASVTAIILVGRAERLREMEELVRAQNYRKVSQVIAGGKRRQDSVRNGLGILQAETEYVAIHDAARPLVRPELIEEVFAAAREQGGAACAAPVSDTLKRVDRQRLVAGGVERENLFAVQTPQIFRRELLERAYTKVFEDNLEVTDEISAVETVNGKVLLVPNEQSNLKITYSSDLTLAELILRSRDKS